jgi:hypothetical protein
MPTLWFQLGELQDWLGFDEPLLRQDAIENKDGDEEIHAYCPSCKGNKFKVEPSGKKYAVNENGEYCEFCEGTGRVSLDSAYYEFVRKQQEVYEGENGAK